MELNSNRVFKAIKNGEFKILYQAKVNIQTMKITGFEGLIRWELENGDIIPPSKFIPKLEETKEIYLIDYYMIECAFKQIKNWILINNMVIPIAINVSKSTILKYDFIDRLVTLIDKYKIPARYIELEITEREKIENLDYLSKIINIVREFGIKVSIDDFGVDESNIFAISSIDFDGLKIDKSIIGNIGKNKMTDSILIGIKSIMDKHKIKVIAEGIETEEQYLKLLEYGYEYGQGYYFSKPQSIEKLNLSSAVEYNVNDY